MLEQWIKKILGSHAASTLWGIITGAAAGAATTAMSGNTSKEALTTGAIAGAVSAVSGVAGRGYGEN